MKTKVRNTTSVINENQLKHCEKKTGHGSKKMKRLPEMQVLTKDFTSYKIKYKFLRKRK